MFGSGKTEWTGPKRIIVHAGFRKTGTTTIQAFLALNSDRLPTGMVASPRDALTRGWRKAVAAHLEKPQPRALRRELAALREALMGIEADTLLISDENLFGQSMVAPDGRTIFELAAALLPQIEAALDGADLQFVLYTRDRDPWLRSAWAQGVKRSGIADGFEDWRAALPDLDPHDGVETIRAALRAPLHVFAMEDDLASEDPLMGRALFRLAGLDDAALADCARPGRSNESLPASALTFLRKLNALDLDTRERRRVARLVEDNPELFAA